MSLEEDVEAGWKDIQAKEDQEFITEITQELGLYLVNQKPIQVEQRWNAPRRKVIPGIFQYIFPQI